MTPRPRPPEASDAPLHPQLSLGDVLTRQLTTTGKWETWATSHPDLIWPDSLDEATQAWQREKTENAYLLVARLTWLGSRRGGDDNDAALAVLVLLDGGIRGLAARLHDICCVDDVRATVWEEVKYAEPQLGRLAPRYLLKRAQQRLLRPAAGLACPRIHTTSLNALLDQEREDPIELVTGAPTGHAAGPVRGAHGEDPRAELADLLAWAQAGGVITADEAALLKELVVVGHLATDVVGRHHLEARHGVAHSTLRRRRAAAVRRLRNAVPAYLADVA